MDKPSWVVESVDLDRPNPARIYDYLLGGHHNFAADRAAAERMLALLPHSADACVVQRAFLRRTVDMCTAEGIDQFLDIGSGLPTMGNVHDLARATIPDARVVYVDVDPVVIAHSSQLLKGDPLATIIEADVRRPTMILEHEEVRNLLDFSRPMGLTMTSLLHFVLEDDLAYSACETLIDALSPGSYVAITHAIVVEGEKQDVVKKAKNDYKAAAEVRPRRREEIARFFDGLEILEPGLVSAPLWRPEAPDDLLLDNPEGYVGLVGVGRKP
ncbi:MAG: SAM-dependent methyltransferase [Anaerolineae bacterium]|nr:SAM-dependent methyltransferase [Anaerolineae bacterium]